MRQRLCHNDLERRTIGGGSVLDNPSRLNIYRRYFVTWLFKVVSSSIRRIWPVRGQDRSVT
jgi:hypothetical protein